MYGGLAYIGCTGGRYIGYTVPGRYTKMAPFSHGAGLGRGVRPAKACSQQLYGMVRYGKANNMVVEPV